MTASAQGEGKGKDARKAQEVRAIRIRIYFHRAAGVSSQSVKHAVKREQSRLHLLCEVVTAAYVFVTSDILAYLC